MLPPPVIREIHRYLHENHWEWRTVCKVINYKYGYRFEIFELEDIFKSCLPGVAVEDGAARERIFKKA